MKNAPARFEFRIWGSHLDKVRDRIVAIGSAAHSEESAETYILSRETDVANVKVRDGLLDIKVMVEQDGRLELWRPALKAEFPLDSRTVVEEVFPTLAVAPPHIEKPSYAHGEFIVDLIRAHRDLAIVEVAKTRWVFEFDRYRAEFAQVKIGGDAESETVEIESDDLALMLRAIAKLGLNSHPNINYVRHLKLMIGMTARTSASAH